MKKSSPAWSLRGKGNDALGPANPGPGTYNPTTVNLEKSPNYRIGKSSRLLRASSDNPGPGSYDPRLQSKLSPRAIIGTSRRTKGGSQEITPGPGQYEKSSSLAGPCYTMRGNRSVNKDSLVPGPGQYTPREEFNKTAAPAYPIGKAKRMTSKDSGVPGPGSYEASSNSSGPKWKVGTQPRLTKMHELVPGPGAYECLSDTSRPSYSMTARRPLTSGSVVPGPGTYSPKHSFNSINYSVGHARRDSLSLSDVPGPASYNLDSPMSKGTVIGSGKRDWVVASEANPGPGAYETLRAWEGPKFSLRRRTSERNDNENPGPGNYNPVKTMKSEPAWRVGKQKRETSSNNKVPGPGAYEKKSSLSGPKWAFPRTQRGKEQKEHIPGPGAYEIKATIPDVPAYLNASGTLK